MTSSILSLEKITHLLNGLKSLPPLQKREPTFMEITGYPHFENVCSNILQFYLQPSNEHGFGTLLLDSLFTLINENVVIDGQNIDVRREESTIKSNRIDLVIESDDFILGIENKIFADEDNPFEDYTEHLNKYLPKVRQIYKVILSLRPKKEAPSLCGFKPITYALFFEKVIANIGSYFLTAREPHITFLRDFIQTIQNLQRETSMDHLRLKFFRDNQQDLAKLLTEVDALRKDMRGRVKLLNSIILDELVKLPYPITPGFWRSPMDFQDVIWYKIELSTIFWLQLDVFVTPSGWWMQFWNPLSGDLNEVKKWIEAREIQTELISIGKMQRLVYKGENNRIPYESKPEDLEKWVLDMLKRITAPIV